MIDGVIFNVKKLFFFLKCMYYNIKINFFWIGYLFFVFKCMMYLVWVWNLLYYYLFDVILYVFIILVEFFN